MSNLCRMIPSDSGPATLTVNARQYVGTVGTPVNVEEMDALELQANGWTRISGYAGTTTQRLALTGMVIGDLFYDSTLTMMMVWTGANWRRVSTGATT